MNGISASDLQFLDWAKRQVIIALFSDDDLMEQLVLKGGNALDLVYDVAPRSSLDVDLSIDGDIDEAILKERVTRVLYETFAEHGYVAFDIKVRSVPPNMSEEMKDFWGGFKIELKVIHNDGYIAYKHNRNELRKRAAILGKDRSTKMRIDISKHEFCGDKQSVIFDHFRIFVYSPAMIVCEKLRAICQQMPSYLKLVNKHQASRARDFVDIYMTTERCGVDFASAQFCDLVQKTFAAKRVQLELIGRIEETREQHRDDFIAVQNTVKPGVALEDYDFYFDYLLNKCRHLKPLWDE